MTRLKVVIVEDELHSRETLNNMLSEYCPNTQVVGLAATVDEGLKTLNEHSPDLVFLDIEMQKETGFDLLAKIKNLNFEVIFTTAFKHYALQAIKFSAIDYLLKPIDVEELQNAVDKVARKREAMLYNKKLEVLLNNVQNKNTREHTITLSTSEGYEFISVSTIIYCEANGSYTNFFIKDKKTLLVSKHLKEYENLLREHSFMRVHQSYLINLSEVEKYVKSEGGYIVMKNGAQINISQKNKEEFIQKMSVR